MHSFSQLLFVASSAERDLLEDGSSEAFTLLHHLYRLSHLLLMRGALFLALGLVLGYDSRSLVVRSLSSVGVLVLTLDLDQTVALEVVQEVDNPRIDMAGRFGKDSLL